MVLTKTNKNDIIAILGPPSTKSSFDTDLWIYIERKTSENSIIRFGKHNILVNNVLILEIDNKGLLIKKDFFDINNMNKYTFAEEITEVTYSKKSLFFSYRRSAKRAEKDYGRNLSVIIKYN